MRVLMISRATLYSSPGGDTVQIVETAKELRKINVDVTIKLANEVVNYSNFDLIHFFNVIRPNTIIPHIKKSKLPFVVSTIFVDYSEVEQRFRGKLNRLLYKIFGLNGMEYLKTIARLVRNNEKILDPFYLIRGHKKSVEYVLNKAQYLLPNSNNEYQRLKSVYHFNTPFIKVPNAVSETFLGKANHEIERKGIVCIARIEPIKNQLNLIKAINNTEHSLKLIGKSAPNHKAYYEECKKIAGDNISFLGQQPKETVIEELKRAKVHILPSWFETTGLSSLEAAALGCNIVITAKGDTQEYFESMAEYCDPDNIQSITNAINKSISLNSNIELQSKVESEYRWNITASITKEVYNKVVNLN